MHRLLILISALFPALLFCDAPTVQLQQQAGPFVITVFSDPTPIRVGRVDLKVLCQQSTDKQTVGNAQVLVHLRRPGVGDILEFTLLAKRGTTQSENMYVASADLPSAGHWPMRIDVRRGSDEASVSSVLDVRPPQPAIVAYWPFFVALPVVALVFAINIRLRRRRDLRKSGAAAGLGNGGR